MTRSCSSSWAARRSALSALAKLKPTLVLEDATVPRSRIPEMVQAMQDIAKKFRLEIGTFGHAGDGNIHVNVLYDRQIPGEREMVNPAVEDIFTIVRKLNGTLSGEHGVGLTKAPYLRMELSEAAIALQRRNKKAFDPHNIMNPGKIFPGLGPRP